MYAGEYHTLCACRVIDCTQLHGLDAQRAMSKRAGSAVTEIHGSHGVYDSQPQAVAAIIAKAAHGVAVVV
jgi:hypothetical protein